jgi:GNAT superfamily N-acetyltransferase
LKTEYVWRGLFDSSEVNALHAVAFEHRTYSTHEWDWRKLVESHSLGWVTARRRGLLMGFVNVPWDGFVHAWIQDAMVSSTCQKEGVGTELVGCATTHVRDAGCEWLHVDFDDNLASFYINACGFSPARAGLIALG